MTNIPQLHADLKAQILNAGDYQPEMIEQSIEQLQKDNDSLQWLIGDIVVWSGYDSKAIEKLAERTGYKISTLKSYARTSKAWDENSRYDILRDNPLVKYSHMKELVSLVNDSEYGMSEALNAINALSNDNFTVKWLRFHIATVIRGNVPKPKKIKVAECDGFFWIDGEDYGNIQLSEKIMGLETGTNYLITIHQIQEDES